jgi:hypothetical protein
MIPKYQDIVDLIKKGPTLEAQEKIMDCDKLFFRCRKKIVS